MAKNILSLSFVALTLCSFAFAFEPSPLQDFCVADPTSPDTRVNGFVCKNPAMVVAEDFFFSGLHLTGNTSNSVGSRVTPVTVTQVPGLNTLSISLVRVDYAPWGINPPHTHPRATEILTVLKGSLHVGFVTSNPENRLITKILKKGDVFVFPIGLVHFQRNVGYGNAVAIATLSSQILESLPLLTLSLDRTQPFLVKSLLRHFKWIRPLWINSNQYYSRAAIYQWQKGCEIPYGALRC